MRCVGACMSGFQTQVLFHTKGFAIRSEVTPQKWMSQPIGSVAFLYAASNTKFL